MSRPLQSFFRSVALLLLLNLLVKPVWIFLIDRQVQLYAGAENYGRYFSLFNFSLLFHIAADAGLSVYLNRRGASAGLDVVLFRFLLRFKCLLLFVYAAAVIIAALAWGLPLNGLLLLMILLQAGTSLLVFLRSALTALQLYRTDAWMSILDKLLVIAAAGWILFVVKPQWFNTEWFAAIQVITVFVTSLIAGILLYKHLPKPANALQEPLTIHSQIMSTLPYLAVVLLMVLVYRAQGVLVQRLHNNGNAEAGLYANGFRLLDAMNMGGYLVASFLLPFISKHAGNRPLITETVQQSRNFLWLSAAAATCFCLFNATRVHEWLYHENNNHNAWITMITLAGIMGCSLVHSYSTVLTATAHIGLLARISLVVALLMLIAGFVFIPLHGAMAAAIITCAGQLVYGLALLAACTTKKILPIDGFNWIKLLLLAGLMVLLLALVQNAPLILQLTLLFAMTFWGAVILKLLRVDFFRPYYN